MKKRRLLLTLLGIALAIAYAALLSLVTPGQHFAIARRAAILVLAMGSYAWCFGSERWISSRQLVLDLVLMPLALVGAAIGGALFALSSVATWAASLVRR